MLFDSFVLGESKMFSVVLSSLPPILHAFSALIAILWISQCLKRMLWHTPKPRDNTPPGSFGLPLVGETLSFHVANNSSRGFYEFIRTRRARHGRCFKTSIFGRTHVFVSTIQAAKLVLSHDMGCFGKYYLRTISELLGEHSVLCASDDYHKFHRHHIGGLFTTQNLASFVRLFDKLTLDALRKWKEGEIVVIYNEALKITFRAMCQMLMSFEKEDELEVLQKDVFLVCEAMLAVPLKIPGSKFFRGLKARERILRTLKNIIDDRRTGSENHDLLQDLVANDSLNDAQIQDNIMSLVIAGQVTTASAFTWMVKYLDENQEVQEKLRDLHLQMAVKNSTSELGMQTLNEMTYASKVVKETLRMASIVSWFPMTAMQDCEIEGFQVKKGWVVSVDVRCIHNDEAIYQDPAKFLPSRFNEDPKPYCFLAFGTGVKTCLGINLAKAMMMVFVHRLVTSYRWRVTDSNPSVMKGALFPRLKTGCPVIVTPIECSN